jgi:hypothetical protein
MNSRTYIHRKYGYTIVVSSNQTMLDLHRMGIKLSEFIPTAHTNKTSK